VKGINASTTHRAALFALHQEIDLITQASEGFQHAKSNALAALAEIEQMPHRIHNANALISRLPDELVAYIFRVGIADFTPSDIASRPSPCLKYVLAISSTSHSWRRVALATPPLWKHITYDYPLVADDIPDLSKMSLYLERSKGELLDISVTFEPRHVRQLDRLMVLLQPHLHRCQRLELNLSNYTVGRVLPLIGPLDALHILDICVSDFSRNVSEQPAVPLRLVNDGHHCQLQSLHLAGPYPFKRSHLNPSRLSRLHYIADGTSFSSVARFAAHFSLLHSLEITMINPPRALVDTYILPSLQSLSIINLEAFRIILHLEGPVLRHLHLWMQADAETDDNIPRQAFSNRPPISFPNLRTFSLTSSTAESDLSTAGLLAHYIGAHALLQGLRFSADVLGLDTLMILAAVVVDHTQTEQSNLRLIRAVLLPPREREVVPPSTSMHSEMAELLTVFVRCVPTIRIQVQIRKGEPIPDVFIALRESYPSQVECAHAFTKSVAEIVDEMEKWEGG